MGCVWWDVLPSKHPNTTPACICSTTLCILSCKMSKEDRGCSMIKVPWNATVANAKRATLQGLGHGPIWKESVTEWRQGSIYVVALVVENYGQGLPNIVMYIYMFRWFSKKYLFGITVGSPCHLQVGISHARHFILQPMWVAWATSCRAPRSGHPCRTFHPHPMDPAIRASTQHSRQSGP